MTSSSSVLYTATGADVVQVLNLFLALLLSSFGAQSLKSKNGANGNDSSDDAPNKLLEAIDRIKRWSAYVQSRCCPLSSSHRTVVNSDADQPIKDSQSLPDQGQSANGHLRRYPVFATVT